METHKEKLETLENNVSDIQEGMSKMFVELQRLLESLNSRGDSGRGSPSRSRINEKSFFATATEQTGVFEVCRRRLHGVA